MQDLFTRASNASQGMTEKAPGRWATFWRRAYRPLGFQKGYNFILFFIFAGAMLGFSLARISYLNVGGSAVSSYKNGSSPGEWYWNSEGHYRFGITLHLCTILPAGLLMIWQFVPVIRHKFLLFHRINGYLVILLIILGNVGALMICRRAFGGTVDTQVVVGVLVILTTSSLALGYYNIKRLQIDQHRAWMLRAMFYLGTIITTRFIMIIAAQVVSAMNDYNTTTSCDELNFIYSTINPGLVNQFYPQCAGTDPSTIVVVHADFGTERPEQIGSSLGINFGMALWLALLIHLIGVEFYLALTPKESTRLRQVSYERQMEKGFKNPGSAGLTAERLGDADAWKPAV